MRRFVADLHVHSLLSPCAAVEMTPRNIVWHAAQHGIDIVAITDHNACDNVQAAMVAAKGSNVTILPAMEVETKEEIHLIILFEKMRQLREWEGIVKSHMSGRLNNADKFGGQFVVDAEDNLIAVKEEMLLTSLTLGLSEIAARAAAAGGLCIASHIDRPVYSVLSQLGFIPPGIDLAALEISPRTNRQDIVRKMPALAAWPIVTSSDAHTIEDFIGGPKTVFNMEEPTLAEIRQALRSENQRGVVV
ncbi:MAG: PHP domain-containing protein [Negativicutes bacterium]|nr:PHP domain-containing protein [Negativicutes bacterium]